MHPVFAQLIAVSRVHWLNSVPQIIEQAREKRKRPILHTLGFPDLAIIFERPEGDEGIVGGAASEDFGSRMPDV